MIRIAPLFAALFTALFVLVPFEARSQELPPPYPRPGVTRMFENADLVVWNISWLKQAYPVHRHRWDLVGVYYTDGDRIIVSTEGERRPVHTDAWNTAFQLSGVTHAEEGASDQPLRAVFVEIKKKGAYGTASGVGVPFPVGNPSERLNNERVAIWDYERPADAPSTLHRHLHDAVIVAFDAQRRPTVRFLPQGTAHGSDQLPGATRTFVFEIK